MKIYILILMLFLFSDVRANLYKPYIDPKEFEKNIFFNEYLSLDKLYFENERESFLEVYFKDDNLDNEYSLLGNGYVTYGIYKKDNLKKYVYTESFYNCDKATIFSNQFVFNSNGDYIFSRAFVLNFKDEVKEIALKLCMDDENREALNIVPSPA